MANFFDIGVNLGDKAFAKDLDEVVERALAAGVDKMLVIGTCLSSSEQALKLAEQYAPHCYATAGVHPHDAKDMRPEHWAVLRDFVREKTVVAIGEAGLDFNRDFSPRPVQEQVFEQQIELACETGLPLFCHERDASERFFEIIRHYRDHLNGAVVHCFTADKEALYRYLDLDLYIGITGWVCDERRGTHLHPLLSDIPKNRLLVETDAPYLLPRTLSPKPKKRRNEPAFVVEVVREIARVTGRSETEIAQQCYQNALTLFKIPE